MPLEEKAGDSCTPLTTSSSLPHTPFSTKHCFQNAPSLLGDPTPECEHLHLNHPEHLALMNPAPAGKANTAIALQRWMRTRISPQNPSLPQRLTKESKEKSALPHLLRLALLPPLLNHQHRLASQRKSLRKRKRTKKSKRRLPSQPLDPPQGGPDVSPNPDMTKAAFTVESPGLKLTKCRQGNGRKWSENSLVHLSKCQRCYRNRERLEMFLPHLQRENHLPQKTLRQMILNQKVQ